MKYKNRIVLAVEGIDGAGKTTLINEISIFFGNDVIFYERTKKGKFINKLIATKLMQRHHMLQVPIYLLLSYKNFLLLQIRYRHNQIIVMDRCFLSNICYFFPKALFDYKLLKRLLWLEVNFFPKTIFIIDVEPTVGRLRDKNKKSLEWLTATRNAYINVTKSMITDWINIRVIEDNLSIESKANIIIKYIQGEINNGN